MRIDEHAMEHPKVAGLPDGAFRLWVCGLSYCQKFLTDGFISDTALRGLRGFTGKRRTELVTAGLWQNAANGIAIHDYLDWNESREHVLNSREQARERLRKHKEKRVSNASANAHPTVGVCVDISQKVQEARKERGLGKTVDDPSVRAGRFCNEVYPALYAKYRKGARYVSRPTFDFQEALTLCRTWDDERLSKLAVVFLTTDHEFAEKGSRTMAQFRSLASWCDSRLTEYEAEHGPITVAS